MYLFKSILCLAIALVCVQVIQSIPKTTGANDKSGVSVQFYIDSDCRDKPLGNGDVNVVSYNINTRQLDVQIFGSWTNQHTSVKGVKPQQCRNINIGKGVLSRYRSLMLIQNFSSTNIANS